MELCINQINRIGGLIAGKGTRKFAFCPYSESRREWLPLVCKYAAGGHTRNKDFQVWSHDNHAEEIWSRKFILQKINYLHDNRVKAGLASEPQHWLYSSAMDYCLGNTSRSNQSNLVGTFIRQGVAKGYGIIRLRLEPEPNGTPTIGTWHCQLR